MITLTYVTSALMIQSSSCLAGLRPECYMNTLVCVLLKYRHSIFVRACVWTRVCVSITIFISLFFSLICRLVNLEINSFSWSDINVKVSYKILLIFYIFIFILFCSSIYSNLTACLTVCVCVCAACLHTAEFSES